ncbi:MAG: DUF3696 domain-containing protein [Nitrospirae bacterium]|nr:DUF3696 domain-containing protein [Nitrospirota bacterium]
MITLLQIKNFKAHASTELGLSSINILTGLNGIGKSSALQSILLLRQSYMKNLLSKGLDLNGDLCSVGTAKDAIFISAETDEIEFEIKQKNKEDIKLVFGVNRNRIIDTFLRRTSVSNLPIPDSSVFNNNFQYISAFRNGPVSIYEKDTAIVEIFKQMSRREGRCELVAHYLYHFKEENVSDKSMTKVKDKVKDDDPTLKFQVMEWMREISPDIGNIHIEEVAEAGYKVEYSFSRGEGETVTNRFKAMDVGFGISYVLPIIVAALHTRKDGLVLVENPESHIHPAGQAKLMELICKSAKAGVQFIIETHSDHIINGLLVATKKGIIDPEDSRVYYFDRKVSTHATQVIHLPVLTGGKIRKPPKGFFDQIAKDMTTLMGLKEWG